MKSALLSTILGAVILAVPAASFAATYQYVNTQGVLATVTADTAAQALKTSDIALHSGVILVTPVVATSTMTASTSPVMSSSTSMTTVTSTPNSISITTTPATTTAATSTMATSTMTTSTTTSATSTTM